MAGLVGYASSDEDEEIEQTVPIASPSTAAAPIKAPGPEPEPEPTKSEGEGLKQTPQKANTEGSCHETSPLKDEAGQDVATIGPVQQNSIPLGPSLPQMEEPLVDEEANSGEAPLSPYSANRALLRDLTLPTAPNLDIPPSPPGSPTPGANKKFEQFLELKKKGVHFNAKLEQSSSLKNPSLMDKLLNFVEIDNRNQYSTTVPTDLWDPNGFPEWAFKDRLRKSRDKIAKEKEAEKASGVRTAIDFAPSTTATSAGSGTAGLSRDKRKSGWK